MKAEYKKLNFSNWVPVKFIIVPVLIGVICVWAGFLHWLFFIPAGLFLIIAIYFAVSWYLFSPGGKDIQNQVQDLLVSQINWDGKGKVLDIGCGNGPLSIKLAGCFPQAEITGVDYWGKNWDYSMQTCTDNCRLAGVDRRVNFQHASASHLPFENASFDLVVSNLVFHEVKDVADKRQCIREALRVLKPGGVFVLQDLFLIESYYGTPKELTDLVRSWGVKQVEFLRTCDESFIPLWVKLPFMIGTVSILKGVK